MRHWSDSTSLTLPPVSWGSKITNSGRILQIFFPFSNGRNPPRCSIYNVYDDAVVWKLFDDEAFVLVPLDDEADKAGWPGWREDNSSASDSPCLIIVQWIRTESGWGFITNCRKSEAFGIQHYQCEDIR